MTDAPLFERIPAPPKTYDQLVELNHYYIKRLERAEDRLLDLISVLKYGDTPEGDPYATWSLAIDQIREWEIFDLENQE